MNETEIAGKMSQLLHRATRELVRWLEECLPEIDEAWWATLVIPSLSYQQNLQVKQRDITALQQLDLAAILRIIDHNWYALSQRLKLSYQDRNYVKEMRTVRNRWAHVHVEGVSSDVVYRDVDTLQRLLEMAGVSLEMSQELSDFKSSLIRKPPKPTQAVETIEQPSAQSRPEFPKGEIEVGSLVALKSDPSQTGAVIGVEGVGSNARYTVFINGRPQPFYMSQLEPVTQEEIGESIPIEQVHAYLTGLQINHPSLSTLYSLNSARIDFVPYQYRPALKIIRSDRPRLLIADGVGVGKTIEAGLVLRELQARQDIRTVLIVCPKPLVSERKWELEMKRFDEQFTPLDGKLLKYCLDETDLEGEWPEQYGKAILPYSLFDERLLYGTKDGRRNRKGLLDLDPPPRFDVVIVDEAHHIRNATTFSHQAVSFFCEQSEAVLFLTATPIQLGNRDLFTLLNVLRPDLVIDEESYNHMAEPNPYINQALRHIRAGDDNWREEAGLALTKAAETSWGKALLKQNPDFEETYSKLSEKDISRQDRVSLIGQVEGFHSFSRLINRTRRRDIGDFCIRKPETIETPFTPAQRELHDALLTFEAEALAKQHGDQNVRFMMTTIRRQAASSLFGLAPFIGDLLRRRLSELDWLGVEADEGMELNVSDDLSSMAVRIAQMAERLPEADPKFDALYRIVEQKKGLPNNKLIVFSTFRHTLAYLRRRLVEKGVRAGLVHGGTEDEERHVMRRRFEMPHESADALDVLLFSEIGCEGLDYQFCDGMVNYDLPWNPMRIEQRIGRIDRRGQKSETVAIYNLITPETIDADIYERCLLRIGVFEASIGDCEEILGEINRAIVDIGTSLSLSQEERQQKLEQLADNEVRKIQEQRALEDREHELFGLKLPKLAIDNDVRQSESFWLSPFSIERFVSQYLAKRCGRQDLILGDKPLKTLRLSQEARSLLLEDFRALKLQKAPANRLWEKWLKGSEQHCSITFDSECAADNREAHFIMPLHPLVKQAASCLNCTSPVYTAFQVSTFEHQPGEHPFAVYAWEFKGIRPELKLVPVCENADLREDFFALLEAGIDCPAAKPLCDEQNFDDLDHIHVRMWEDAVSGHIASLRLSKGEPGNEPQIPSSCNRGPIRTCH
jgi:superfamily II DNA or RNA helicase